MKLIRRIRPDAWCDYERFLTETADGVRLGWTCLAGRIPDDATEDEIVRILISSQPAGAQGYQ